jgi:RNA polymerase sigma factor (sigma-70 family)
MPNSALFAAVSRIGRSGRHALDDATDGKLLGRFVQSRDESAFRELVLRIGPMVLGVCQRVSGDAHLAEDAFQAAFLVLARRAADVRPAEGVRGWLYGVAVRTAREARSVSARRRLREMPVLTLPDRPAEHAEVADADSLRVLDEEIGVLPEYLRATVVLCELGGVSRKDAAARLNVPEGTVCSRLAKARKVLALRLRKRGIALSVVAMATIRRASAAVSPRLAASTTALAARSGPVPFAVATLAHGVFRTMFFLKLKVATAGALVAAVLVVAGSRLPELAAQEPTKQKSTPASKPEEKKPPPAPTPAAKPAGPGTLVLLRPESIGLVTPDGKKGIEFELPTNTKTFRAATLSPDGSRVAFVVIEKDAPLLNTADSTHPLKVVVCKTDKTAAERVVELPAIDIHLCWTGDGKKLVAAKTTELPPDAKYESVLLDPERGTAEKIDLPAGVRVLDCGKDGKTFVVETFDAKAKKKVLGIATKGQDTTRELTELQGHSGRAIAQLSPDGTKLLLIDGDPERKDAHKWGCSDRPYVVDVKSGKRETLADFPANGRAFGIAWSPDGKRLAYTWQPLDEELLKKDSIGGNDAVKESEGFLVVADADGKNAKTIVSDKGQFALNMVLGAIEWR